MGARLPLGIYVVVGSCQYSVPCHSALSILLKEKVSPDIKYETEVEKNAGVVEVFWNFIIVEFYVWGILVKWEGFDIPLVQAVVLFTEVILTEIFNSGARQDIIEFSIHRYRKIERHFGGIFSCEDWKAFELEGCVKLIFCCELRTVLCSRGMVLVSAVGQREILA